MREHDKNVGGAPRTRRAEVPADFGITHPLPGRTGEPERDTRGEEAVLDALLGAGYTPAPEELGRLDHLIRSLRRAGSIADEPGAPARSYTALNAPRGIINTGLVHGGQHVTDIAASGDRARGADDDH
ncbi:MULTISPECIES: hypothetical protein [unclassified Streptomyces]|uniref:hypothetical protein n=1 Tax=unclassified Streptomyces TaxID=2593676 RepID=UPI002E78C966|nr:hypothetical protein [Streptomyces sp. JV184]MEE1745616.1 hypothetical protein [Streptomyces sp. JV184]